MCCEKNAKKEWEEKNNIKTAIIGGTTKKQTLVECLKELYKVDAQENEQEER